MVEEKQGGERILPPPPDKIGLSTSYKILYPASARNARDLRLFNESLVIAGIDRLPVKTIGPRAIIILWDYIGNSKHNISGGMTISIYI